MDIQGALGLAKDHAERHSKAFAAFFGRRGPAGEEAAPTFDHVTSGAIIYLIIGVTLQDSFISGMKIEDISWLDRALGQLVFWVSIALIVQALVRLLGSGPGSGGITATFRVMPIAFLCGAYAASVGFFLNHVLRMVATPIPNLPHLFHIVTQIAIIGAYMPAELRARVRLGTGSSRLVAGITMLIVLLVDMIVVFGSWFMPAA